MPTGSSIYWRKAYINIKQIYLLKPTSVWPWFFISYLEIKIKSIIREQEFTLALLSFPFFFLGIIQILEVIPKHSTTNYL